MIAPLFFAIVAAAAPASGASELVRKTDSFAKLGVGLRVDSFTLGNGLRVHVQEDHSANAFTLVVAYDVGSRDEVAGRTGFAHLFEHMMYKGSANVPEGGNFTHVMSTGGDVDAFTLNDATMYCSIMPSAYLDRALWLEADRMRSLAITDENLDNQRKAVLEEKAMHIDNVPYASAIQDFFAEIWVGTGYGHIMMGSDADLQAATTADVKAFFAKYYVPSNAVMVVTGDVDPAEVRRRVEHYFADIPAGQPRERFATVDHKQTKVEKRVVDPLAPQPLVVVGWKTVPHDHPDAPALELLGDILVTGNSARLTRVLQDEKNLAFPSPIGASDSGGRDAGATFFGFVLIGAAQPDQVLAVVHEGIAAIQKRGVTPKELEKAIRGRTVATVESLASNFERAVEIAEGSLCCGDPTHAITQLRGYRAVRPADIQRVAKRYLTDAWMLLEVRPPK